MNMPFMSKGIYRISILLVFAGVFLISSCSDNSTGSNPTFGVGTYIGTYSVQLSPYDDPKVDTVEFRFQANNKFYMQVLDQDYLDFLDTVIISRGDTIIDNDREFCDITNVDYDVPLYTDSVQIIVPGNYNYTEICVHEENPGDKYRISTTSTTILLRGSVEAFDRRIVLWAD